MSQVDKLHYMTTIFWIVIGFLIWYCFIIGFIIPIYYKVFRIRYRYEKMIMEKIKKNENIIYMYNEELGDFVTYKISDEIMKKTYFLSNGEQFKIVSGILFKLWTFDDEMRSLKTFSENGMLMKQHYNDINIINSSLIEGINKNVDKIISYSRDDMVVS